MLYKLTARAFANLIFIGSSTNLLLRGRDLTCLREDLLDLKDLIRG